MTLEQSSKTLETVWILHSPDQFLEQRGFSNEKLERRPDHDRDQPIRRH